MTGRFRADVKNNVIRVDRAFCVGALFIFFCLVDVIVYRRGCPLQQRVLGRVGDRKSVV